MNHESIDTLSPAGAERCEAMLGELVTTMRRVHRRRRVRRRAGAAGGLAVLAALTALPLLAPWRTPERAQVVQRPIVPPVDPPAAVITIVHTDPAVLDRHRPATTFTARVLDDRRLVATLHAIDRPAGLVRAGDRVWLTRDVADEG